MEDFKPTFNHKPLEASVNVDMSGWNSPVDVYIRNTVTGMNEKRDGEIVAQISEQVGVNVDKDELMKALKYDRNQYEEGYRAGYAAGRGSNPVPIKITTAHGYEMTGYYDEVRDLVNLNPFPPTLVAELGYTWEKVKEGEDNEDED